MYTKNRKEAIQSLGSLKEVLFMALETAYQQFIHLSRYSRWRDEDNRRETWEETVDRYVNYMQVALSEHNNYELTEDLKSELREAILNTEVMPSMRGIMTAGPALDRDSTCIYNCSYLPVDHLRSFDEAMYILMCGTGVGYSVEAKYVNKLPAINEHFENTGTVIKVGDSKAGWAKGLRELISLLWSGQIPTWDLSDVRPAGERLKTFGGRASGPGPLDKLFKFVVAKVTNAAGRRLSPLEAHDIMCKIAEVVVVGGVRRSAMISLSDVNDQELAKAKSGRWWEDNGQRSLSNNSAVYEQKPSMEVFMNEWHDLYESKSGERGIFSRQAATKIASKNGRRKTEGIDFGTNPCSEIILRPYGFCNLTEVVVKESDTLEDLKRKVRQAAIIGTMQASFTRFKYLRKIWKQNAEEEALLGVSLTGQLGHQVLSGRLGKEELESWLTEMRKEAIAVNKEFAETLGIRQSAAITCVKPSGTVSQLVLCSSGMHTWHSEYYIRTVRGDTKDPLTEFMTMFGVPNEPDVMRPESTTVFKFPIKAPENALTRNDLTAIEHLELWLTYQRTWCEHKPSITISVKEDEWMKVGAWVYDHIDEMSGVSFLPHSDHSYKQAPYQECTKEEYETLLAEMPKLNWNYLTEFETEDTTEGSQTLACSANNCEVVDIKAASVAPTNV
jgi:ribonucleoside-triphosphate reductase